MGDNSKGTPPTSFFKRLSRAEMAERRAKGLCFNCDESYSTGHKCKRLFWIKVLDDDSEGEEEGETHPEISLHAISGVRNSQTMQLLAASHGIPVSILVDSGSTHNFVREGLVLNLKVEIQKRPNLKVCVANGERVPSLGLCKSVPLQVGKDTFSIDLYMLPLEGFDMILGVKWLRTLGPIIWGFRSLKMKFVLVGKEVLWRDHPLESKTGTTMIRSEEFMGNKLESLLEDYDDLFQEPASLPPPRNCDHRITLLPGSAPMVDEEAFEQLKKSLSEAPVLSLPNFFEEFVVECDASGSEFGAILQQLGHPIAFFSRKIAEHHLKLAAYERELIGLAKVVIHWRSYLWGRHFLIRTDHYSLKHLLEQRITTSPQQHWISKLMGFDFRVEFKADHLNRAADALSRCHKEEPIIMALSIPCAEIFNKHEANMKRDILTFVRQCVTCQCNKWQNLQPTGLLQPLSIPEQVSADISMDFIESLLKVKGKLVLFVIVDRLSKYAHFIPLAHPYTTISVAAIFFNEIFRLHGMPESIVSDCYKVFLSSFWRELFRLCGTKLSFSSAYHLQTNRQTEMVNRTIKMYLRCLVGDQPQKWLEWLPWAEYCDNTFFHTALGATPFQLVYGRVPPRLLSYSGGSTCVAAVDHALMERDEVLQVARARLLQSQQRTKLAFDSSHRELSCAVGDWVWLRLQPYC
ncbi:hypothetical protein ZIOFF_051698 [Zingiber officinale]|uniref:Integrase catalytic domain-containing protein n=1 Tax=Zingiber officinale TaxID=94328 RepID=A0A8J5FKY0_ZINOF|nr:hypothetical protein ZIOFF_051698 [Zingiber officinale]